jgi:ATP-binding cassette subfamily B protein
VDSVDLEVDAGRVVALFGETGSGKSTVLSLIDRLHDPDAGSVLIGGRSAKELDLTALRQEVAVAVDDAFLFSGTVRDNIAYGRPDASDGEIRDAARRAQADRFIEALPNGYDTEVGWRGFNLSGGQRARISIARALIADGGILLLDNVTASLDAHTELEQLAEFGRNLREQTTVIVAHRSPSLALADEVVVFRHGRVVARGSHEALLAGNTYYRSLMGPDLRDGAPDR